MNYGIIAGGLETYLFASLPVIAYVIKLTIDNWGITELEKIRLSNFKKFQIAITKYLFMGIIFLIAMYLIIIFSDGIAEKDGKMIYGILAITLIIFITIMVVVEKIVYLISVLLSFQYDYYIVNNDGENDYRIIKLSSNNLLLVESDGIEEFIDANENRRYKRVRRDNDMLNRLYSHDKIKHFIIGIVILGISCLVGILFTESWWQFCFYLSFVFTMIVSLILIFNYLDNKKYRES